MVEVVDWVRASTPDEWGRRARGDCPDHLVADCGSKESHRRRLLALSRLPLQDGDHVEDLGCGTGLLSELLPDGVSYEGLDWSSEIVSLAAERRPKRSFRVGGVDDLTPADWVVASGPFNYTEGWDRRRTEEAIRAMWHAARRGIGVTVLRIAGPGRLAYTAAELIGYIEGRDWSVAQVDRSYLPNDMCVRVWRS